MELSNKQKIISFILKLIVIISAIIGIILSAISSIDSFMGGEAVFMYFTIQSNILIALVCLIGLLLIILNKNIKYWNIIKFVSTISITLTGLVFSFVLAPTMGSDAWILANVLTHVVVPLAAIIDFFVVGIKFNFNKRDVLFVIIPPLLYAIYAFIGYNLNWQFSKDTNYPYFFLNWGSKAKAFGFTNELPFMGVMWWIILLLILLIILGIIYLKIINLLKKKYNNN